MTLSNESIVEIFLDTIKFMIISIVLKVGENVVGLIKLGDIVGNEPILLLLLDFPSRLDNNTITNTTIQIPPAISTKINFINISLSLIDDDDDDDNDDIF